MQTITTPIPGLLVIKQDLHKDDRGWFIENWHQQKQIQDLKHFAPVQNNISYNHKAGTTRGLHAEPWNKLVTVTTGKVFAAWVDLRTDQRTTFTLEINPGIAVFVPSGVANSYQTLEDNTAYSYLVNAHYDPSLKYQAISLDQPNINWPIPLDQAIISQKDLANAKTTETIPKPKTLVIGNGQLAKELLKYPNTVQLKRPEFDLTKDQLDLENVATVINAAAYTKVDLAEDEPQQAFAVNAQAVEKLAQQTKLKNIKLVHISSDYIFDGTKLIHPEDETPNPLNVYGLTKAAGDIAAKLNPNHLIIRTSWVMGDGENFLKKIKNIPNPRVITTQHGRPTFTQDLAKGIMHLINQDQVGTFNLTNDGPTTTWYELAKIVNSNTEPTQEHSSKAKRPEHSTLDLTKIQKAGFHPRDWREAIKDF